METLKKFGINVKKDGIENAAIYSVACVFSLLERQIIEYLKPYNLSPSQFNALMIIKHVGKNKGLSQIEIGDKLIVSASNMTRLLDKLTKEGFVERYAQQHDRRVNLIKITQKGSELLDNVWPGYLENIKQLTCDLDKNELLEITTLMVRWFDALDKK